MRTEQIPLLKADPDLGALLSEPRRSDAERRLLVSTHRLVVGTCWGSAVPHELDA